MISTRAPHLIAMMSLLLSGSAFAEMADSKSQQDLQTRPYLLGDWGGLRSQLATDGVTFSLGYTGEFAHNFRGGTRHVSDYADQFALGTTLNLDRLFGWQGGTFQVTFSKRGGESTSNDAQLGTLQQVQEIYGRGETWRLTRFYLDQKFMGDTVDLRLGRMTISDDFSSFPCDFQNNMICGAVPAKIVSAYWFTYPVSVWAARLKVKTSAETYAQLGVYQVNPVFGTTAYAEDYGWRLDNPKGTRGAMFPLELGWLPTVAGYPASYRLGFWYNNAGGDDLLLNTQGQPLAVSGGAPMQRSSRYGSYLNLDQQVTGVAKGQGLSLFWRSAFADQATSQTDRVINIGAKYTAPFDRPDDYVGFTIGALHTNNRYNTFVDQSRLVQHQREVAPKHNEYVVEAIYNIGVIHSISIAPDLQYVIHPGGTTDNKNALVFGLKTNVSF